MLYETAPIRLYAIETYAIRTCAMSIETCAIVYCIGMVAISCTNVWYVSRMCDIGLSAINSMLSIVCYRNMCYRDVCNIVYVIRLCTN